MANLTHILLATFLSTFAAGAASASDQTGQICIAAWSSTGGDVPSNRWVHQDSTFLITGLNIKGTEIRSGDQQVILETLVRARISVALDGKPMESFRVTLDAYPAKRACMWLYFPHVTWQIEPYIHGTHGCSCFGT